MPTRRAFTFGTLAAAVAGLFCRRSQAAIPQGEPRYTPEWMLEQLNRIVPPGYRIESAGVCMAPDGSDLKIELHAVHDEKARRPVFIKPATIC